MKLVNSINVVMTISAILKYTQKNPPLTESWRSLTTGEISVKVFCISQELMIPYNCFRKVIFVLSSINDRHYLVARRTAEKT